MEALAILGMVFGTLGFVFGLLGFIFGVLAYAKTRRLELRLGDTAQERRIRERRRRLEDHATPSLEPSRDLYPALGGSAMEPATVGGRIVPSAVVDRAREALQAGEKIRAVKQVREDTGLGLKDAVDLVEQLQRGQRVGR